MSGPATSKKPVTRGEAALYLTMVLTAVCAVLYAYVGGWGWALATFVGLATCLGIVIRWMFHDEGWSRR